VGQRPSPAQAAGRGEWTKIDDKIDTALRELRATSPNPTSEKAALNELLGALG
jgi:hypothetical protein